MEEKFKNFLDLNRENIKRKCINILNESDINQLDQTFEVLQKTVSLSISLNKTHYFILESLGEYIDEFNKIYNRISVGTNHQSLIVDIDLLYSQVIQGNTQTSNQNIHPFYLIQSFLKTLKLENSKSNKNENLFVRENEKIYLDLTKEKNEMELLRIEISSAYDKFTNQIQGSLNLLNKSNEAIGVERYVNIFEDQSDKHSFFEIKIHGKKSKLKLGRSQLWLIISGFLLFFIYPVYLKLETTFPINEIISKDGVPYLSSLSIVHLVARFVIISLYVFIITFSLKQYRINMHLSVMNKHRANTLKSFNFLTAGTERINDSAYNAILMEVAKSIYESGQTGYVSNNEVQNDGPSFYDLSSKFISPGN